MTGDTLRRSEVLETLRCQRRVYLMAYEDVLERVERMSPPAVNLLQAAVQDVHSLMGKANGVLGAMLALGFTSEEIDGR